MPPRRTRDRRSARRDSDASIPGTGAVHAADISRNAGSAARRAAQISARALPDRAQRSVVRLALLGAARSIAAAGRLGLLADPRRPRRRQDARRRGGGARMGQDLSDRQSDRPDQRRCARRDGARRIRRTRLLSKVRAPALRARLGAPLMAQWRDLAIVLGRGARPAARQAAYEALVRRTGGLALSRCLRTGFARPAPRRLPAGRHHHDAAADQDHQAIAGGQGRDRDARRDIRQRRPSRPGLPQANHRPL